MEEKSRLSRLSRFRSLVRQELEKEKQERKKNDQNFWRSILIGFIVTSSVIIIIMWITMTFWYWFPAILFAIAFAIFLPTLALSAFIEEEDRKEKHKDNLYPLVSGFVVLGFMYLLFFRWAPLDFEIGLLLLFLLVAGVVGYIIGKKARGVYKRVRKNDREKDVTDRRLLEEVTTGIPPKRTPRIIFT